MHAMAQCDPGKSELDIKAEGNLIFFIQKILCTQQTTAILISLLFNSFVLNNLQKKYKKRREGEQERGTENKQRKKRVEEEKAKEKAQSTHLLTFSNTNPPDFSLIYIHTYIKQHHSIHHLMMTISYVFTYICRRHDEQYIYFFYFVFISSEKFCTNLVQPPFHFISSFLFHYNKIIKRRKTMDLYVA